jgi:ribose transport system substrate-binding protein
VIKITPAVWDNTDEAHVADLKKVYDAKLDPFYGVAYEVKPYTTYSMAQILACKGP